MPRNLDLTALRSFVAIADAGGVTRAAGFLNLTQSAVSMQIRRLEDSLGLDLLDRSGRGVSLTPAGEQLLGHARKMLALNDEVYARLTQSAHEGEVVLGVPHDIVYPGIPQVLQAFAREFPKMKVTLNASFTRTLLAQFARGECDLILTTEDSVGPGGETLTELPLLWIGARGGQAWRQRPLRLAHEQSCFFRQPTQAALDRAGIPWVMAMDGTSSRATEAIVSADLAVHTMLAGTEPAHVERIAHGGTLPDLGSLKVNLYLSEAATDPARRKLADLLRHAYGAAPAHPRIAMAAGA